MNLSLRTLRSLVPSLSGSPDEIAERLTRNGLEVTRVVSLRELLQPIVVARVESVQQHPNADRLKVCVVNDGGDAPLQIITGADNVRAGACYPLVRSGTTLPNGTKIKRGKLRGEVSEGMLGSADELELGGDHAGLMELPGEPVPGRSVVEVVDADGAVFVLQGDPTPEEIARALQ